MIRHWISRWWRLRRLPKTQVAAFGSHTFRISTRRRKIVAIEMWVKDSDAYAYYVWGAQ